MTTQPTILGIERFKSLTPEAGRAFFKAGGKVKDGPRQEEVSAKDLALGQMLRTSDPQDLARILMRGFCLKHEDAAEIMGWWGNQEFHLHRGISKEKIDAHLRAAAADTKSRPEGYLLPTGTGKIESLLFLPKVAEEVPESDRQAAEDRLYDLLKEIDSMNSPVARTAFWALKRDEIMQLIATEWKRGHSWIGMFIALIPSIDQRAFPERAPQQRYGHWGQPV